MLGRIKESWKHLYPIWVGGWILFWLFVLDKGIFDYGMWFLPNEFAWNTQYFYNFTYEWKKLQRTPKTKPRIFIVGSSIGYYSIDKSSLEETIQKNLGREVEVSYFCYAGNSPLYVYLFLEKLIELQPDLVVYPFNFIDFRLHRAGVLNPQNPQVESASEEALVRDAVAEEEAPQARLILPWETFWELGESLDWEKRAELLMASLFHFYRYKEFLLDSLYELFQHRFGKNTSYHAYNGVQIPERVNSLGWTSQKFSFLAIPKIQKEGFYIEVVEEFFRKGPLTISIYPYENKQNPSVHHQTLVFTSPGWKKIYLDSEFFQEGSPPFLTVELSHVWYAYEASGFLRDYHRDPMGVRLPQTFGLERPRRDVYFLREERLEDLRYINMDDLTYREYFFYRLLSDLPNRPGIRYLYEIAETKKRIVQENFRPLLHFRYLQKITQKLQEKKVPLLLINNPENPISLEWYGNSKWYEDYLAFFKSLEKDGAVWFVDGKDLARMQDFSDFHHFTYPGMKKWNFWYAEQILKISAFWNLPSP